MASSFVLIMVLLISYDVIARYIFNAPTIWADEISGYLLVGIVFLGLGYGLETGAHISVDLIIDMLSPKKHHSVHLATDILTLLIVIMFTWESFVVVLRSYNEGKIALSLLLTPLYLPQLLIPIGFAVLCLQLILEIFQLLTNKLPMSKNRHKEIK